MERNGGLLQLYFCRKEAMTITPEEYLKLRKKPSKMRNIPCMVDGLKFSSKKESHRWQVLLLREKAGEIRCLERQHRFPLIVGDVEICVYVSDFVYFEKGEYIVEDVKGRKAGPAYSMFTLKKKLMKAIYNIEVKEV